MGQIQYSKNYFDDAYEYRHVVLPPDVFYHLSSQYHGEFHERFSLVLGCGVVDSVDVIGTACLDI